MTQESDPVLSRIVSGLQPANYVSGNMQRLLFNRLGYIPLPVVTAMGIHESTKPWVLIHTGKGAGKTTLATAIGVTMVASDGWRNWVSASRFDLAEKIFFDVWDALMLHGIKEVVSHDRQRHLMNLAKGGLWRAVSWAEPDSIEMESLNGLIIDEGQKLTREIFNKFRPRVRNMPYKVVILGSEDPREQSREQKKFFDTLIATARSFPDRWDYFHWETEENIYFPKERLEQDREEMTVEEFNEIYRGIGRRPIGLVFRPFEAVPGMHMRADAEFDPRLPVYLAVDPGLTGAYGVEFLQIHDEPPEVRVCNEVYERLPTDSIIELCKAKPEWKNVVGGAVDRAAATRELIRGDTVWKAWIGQAGVNLDYSSKIIRITDGNERLMSFILPKLRTVKDESRMVPSFAVHPRCQGLLGEFGALPHPISGMGPYSYRVDMQGNVMSNLPPIDRNNHAIKAVIYWLFSRFGTAKVQAGETRVRHVADPRISAASYVSLGLRGESI